MQIDLQDRMGLLDWIWEGKEDDSQVFSLRNEMNSKCILYRQHRRRDRSGGENDKLSHIYVDYNVVYGIWRQQCQECRIHWVAITILELRERSGMQACLLSHPCPGKSWSPGYEWACPLGIRDMRREKASMSCWKIPNINRKQYKKTEIVSLGRSKVVLWESAAFCLWIQERKKVGRRDWSSMSNTTKQIKSALKNVHWSQGKLLVITEKLFFRSSGNESQIPVGWMRENRTNADLFFQRFCLWTGETDRQTGIIIKSLSQGMAMYWGPTISGSAQCLLYPQKHVIKFVVGCCLCWCFSFSFSFIKWGRSLFLLHT